MTTTLYTSSESHPADEALKSEYSALVMLLSVGGCPEIAKPLRSCLRIAFDKGRLFEAAIAEECKA